MCSRKKNGVAVGRQGRYCYEENEGAGGDCVDGGDVTARGCVSGVTRGGEDVFDNGGGGGELLLVKVCGVVAVTAGDGEAANMVGKKKKKKNCVLS